MPGQAPEPQTAKADVAVASADETSEVAPTEGKNGRSERGPGAKEAPADAVPDEGAVAAVAATMLGI
jgi:hypothetical protein